MATHPLRRERILRGWSQSQVAEALGVTSRTVSRWEQAITIPYPHYREHLCRLFSKSEVELGIVPLPQVEELNPPRPAFVPLPVVVAPGADSEPLLDPAQPYDSSKPLFGRGELLQSIRERLLNVERSSPIALHGLPGVGKTALALALATDAQVQSYFADGILWASLGPQPDLRAILTRWGSLLRLSYDGMDLSDGPAAWALALRAAIGSRRLLLILDDVWSAADALALQVGGMQCASILTTRLPQVAFIFAPEGVMLVPELEGVSALAMLASFVPYLVEQDSENIRLLAQAVGGLPLALKLLGTYLGSQAFSGQPRRLRSALISLQQAEQRLCINIPITWDEYTAQQRRDLSLSLYAAIAMSEQQLGVEAHATLCALVVFPAKPSSFSEEAALLVGQTTGETLDELWDAGLLESSSVGRYCLHQTVIDYAHMQEDDHGLQAQVRLVEWMSRFVATHDGNYEVLEDEIANLLAALQVAVEKGQEQIVRKNLLALCPFLRGYTARPYYVVSQVDSLRKALNTLPEGEQFGAML